MIKVERGAHSACRQNRYKKNDYFEYNLIIIKQIFCVLPLFLLFFLVVHVLHALVSGYNHHSLYYLIAIWVRNLLISSYTFFGRPLKSPQWNICYFGSYMPVAAYSSWPYKYLKNQKKNSNYLPNSVGIHNPHKRIQKMAWMSNPTRAQFINENNYFMCVHILASSLHQSGMTNSKYPKCCIEV